MINLLMVDDSRIDRLAQAMFLKDGLEEFDISIQTVDQPLPLTEQYAQYDGLILDYDLVTIKGMTLARRIHEKLPGLPMVILTGMELWHEDFRGHEQHGVIHVLSKNDPAASLVKMVAFCREIVRIKAQLGRRKKLRHGSSVRLPQPGFDGAAKGGE